MYLAEDTLLKKANRRPHIIARKEENCYLLVNRKNGRVLVINDIGYEIWELLVGLSVKEIVKRLSEKYSVEVDECQKQVMNLVQKLLENDFIVLEQ